MKKITNKQTIIVSLISLFSFILIIGSYLFSTTIGRATQVNTTSTKLSRSISQSNEVEKTFHIIAKNEAIASTKKEPVPAIATNATTEKSTVATPKAAAMTITLAGQTISYQNGGQTNGQTIINSNPTGVVSTWGGAAMQSGNDGLNTHFIGHNPGAFSSMFNLTEGNPIVVTDGNGVASTYTVRTIFIANDYGENSLTGKDEWDLIVGTGGGERITLQSCIDDTTNLIVIAYK